MRETMTVADIASRLEHRLHRSEVDEVQLAAGCAFAAEAGLAAVLCRPEHVAAAARHLAGTEVELATALGFHDPASPRHSPAGLANEAAELIADGAGEVALIAAPGIPSDGDLDLLADQVRAVTETASSHGATVRVLLITTGMLEEDIVRTCRVVAEGGARMLQGGSFRGDRTPFSQVETMRVALPKEVLLKWTHPVRSVDTMLMCIALGVDRFNAEPAELLADAARRSRIAPLMVPLRGLDF